MAEFQIEQREAGDPRHGALGWTPIATIEAPSAPHAIHEYCIAMQYFAHQLHHDTALVQGVGWFRAVLPEGSELAHAFVVQRQDPVGPDDLHLTWSNEATVTASDAESALLHFLDARGWMGDAAVFGHVANIVGIGSFRTVPADQVEAMRVTPPQA